MKMETMRPEEIESRSFAIIEEELAKRNIEIDERYRPVVLRVIHATADFDFAENLVFSENAVEKMKELIASGVDICTDTKMARSGINRGALAAYGGEVHCFMGEEDVAKEAKGRGVTRATVSMERAAQMNHPLIFVVGNAPTALIHLKKMMDGGFKPAFIVGVPVGFVNVEAAKELVLESDVPFIVSRGRKGGSTVAVAIINAVLYSMAS